MAMLWHSGKLRSVGWLAAGNPAGGSSGSGSCSGSVPPPPTKLQPAAPSAAPAADAAQSLGKPAPMLIPACNTLSGGPQNSVSSWPKLTQPATANLQLPSWTQLRPGMRCQQDAVQTLCTWAQGGFRCSTPLLSFAAALAAFAPARSAGVSALKPDVQQPVLLLAACAQQALEL